MSHANRPPRLALAASLLLAGCSLTDEASKNATLSKAPGSPGFLVVGLADESAQFGLGAATVGISMAFRSEDGKEAVAGRIACGAPLGFMQSRPCDVRKMDWLVVRVQPGEWRPLAVGATMEVIGGNKALRDQLPPGNPVRVGPGEIVYVGDYVLRVDYDAQEIAVRHGRNDAGAAGALADYPNLRGAPVAYRGAPTRTR